MIEHVAALTLEDVEVRPDLPVDLSPRYPVSFSDKGHKLLEVPRPVNDVLGSYLAVMVDV